MTLNYGIHTHKKMNKQLIIEKMKELIKVREKENKILSEIWFELKRKEQKE